MFTFWKKKKNTTPSPAEESSGSQATSKPTWDTQASQALEQAVSQAPVPGIFKNKLKSELQGAAEQEAKTAGRSNVTAEDLMKGLLSRLPEGMRKKVENAAKEGPEGLKKLEKELGKK